MTPHIPSRFTAAKRHITAVAYVPVAAAFVPGVRSARPAWPLCAPPAGQTYTSSPEIQRIRMWCCGPRNTNICPPGARTTVSILSYLLWTYFNFFQYPCAHGILTMYLAGLVSRNPAAFRSVWSEINLVDAGARSQTFNEEICRSHCG